MSEAKLVKYIPSGERLPYWDKYEYECIDCGKHFYRGTCTSRISPYCAECYRKHEKEKAKENKLRKQELHDKQVIEEFVNKVIKELEDEKSDLTDWSEDKAYLLGIEKAIEIMKQGSVSVEDDRGSECMSSESKKCENIQNVLDKIEPDVEHGRYTVVTAKLFNEIASLLESSRRVDESKEHLFEDRYEEYSFEVRRDLDE